MKNNYYNTQLENFEKYLKLQEKSPNTIKKYIGNLNKFFNWYQENYNKKNIVYDKMIFISYKQYIKNYFNKSSTINSYLNTINIYLQFLKKDFKLKLLKLQKRFNNYNFLDLKTYNILINCAKQENKTKFYCIIQTLFMTGIRVSELKYISVENLEDNIITVESKNKIRQIVIPDKLYEILKRYIKIENIVKGSIFINNINKKPLSSSYIWQKLQKIAIKANVNSKYVYPHNFRHLFASNFLNNSNNIFELADLLGHSNVETTRIYTQNSAKDKLKSLNRIFENSNNPAYF
jgi:site-specific recombinase XerD